jgi:PAS domain S-box-containing protein
MLRNPIFLTACLSVALLLSPTPARALNPSIANTQYGVSSWLSDDGLPQNWIGAIAQTPDGYLWFATEEGVSRFDGVRFTTFLDRRSIGAMLVARDGALWISDDRGLARYKDNKMTVYSTRDGLREGPINSMSEGSDGSIWMATRTGLNRYYQGKFSAYLVTDGSAPTWILSTTVTRDGSLWWGTNGGGLKRLHHGAVTAFTTSDGLADNIVLALREDRKGDLWIGTNKGLSRMHDGTITTIPKAGGLTNQCVKVIQEDRDGNLWIGTDGGGLNRYAGGTFTSFGTDHKLSGTSVLALLEDREGSLWVGTSGVGVTQLRPSKFTTIGPLEGLNADMVWSVREAIDGSLLIGTNHGFRRWKDGAATSVTVREGLSSDIVRSVDEDRSGSIWLATSAGLNRYQNGKVTVYRTADGLPNDTVRTAMEDREGNIWVGTRGGGVARYRDGIFTVFNTANGLAGDLVGPIEESRDGSLWIATDGGVSVFKNGVFTNYTVRNGLSTNSARVIHQDRHGGHWVGTYGGGLNRIKDGHISRISVIDGLFDEVIFAIVEDRKGYLWMTCNRGVFRISLKELNDFADGRIKRVHSTSFDIADGMKAAECNGGSPGAWEGRDGRLFFATVRGVAIVDPNHIPFNTLAPPVRTEEVLVDGNVKNVSPTGLAVSPGRHSLEIHYTALSLVMPKSVRFRYRLLGFSDQWFEAGDRRTAFYTNLPPGNYTFEVMGSNNDGVWSTASNPIQFRFQPAFFQRTSFRIACAVCLLLAVRAAFHIRLKLLHERERVLVRRVDEQTAELTAAKLAAESVAETNTRLRLKNELILNSIADGVYVVDPSGNISLENPAASRMLGWEKSSLVGQPAHAMTHHSTLFGPYLINDCPIHTTMRDGVLREVSDEVFWRKDGTSFPVHYLAAPILDVKERVTGVAVTFRDVTGLKAIEKLKSEFVSTVSHELRTPLTSIRGALGLLGSGLLGPIAEKGQRMLEIAVTNTDRLVRLINNILDLERMDAGKTELTRASVDAETILLQATEGLQSLAEKAGVRIVSKPASGAVWGDSDRIMQTLTNLLANAIKFSPPQTTVTVSGTAREKEFLFCVADEGRGVPDEKLQTIFERFSQVDSSDSRDKGGSGLGLAICQSIVTAHGGRIWVEKNEPTGSRFQFTIPLANKEEQHAA